MTFSRQTTLGSQATVTGVGVHSGKPVSLTLGPAPVDAGYIFVRTGLEGADREIQANAKSVIATEFATVLGDREGPIVSTAEHVLAALRGMGIDNAVIEVDGPEVPIMDGSAAAFVAAIDQAGIVEQGARRRFIQVLKPVQVAIGDSFGEIRPHAAGFRAEVEISFANPMIGRQSYVLDLNPQSFRRDIARARTFGCMNDVARLWSAGFALGASFENSVVFDDDKLLNTEGLRYADECARHKVLDAVGDLALAGLPILGAYRSVRGGHKLNNAVLCALMADRSAWKVVEADAAHLQNAPARRGRASADVTSGMLGGMIAPAFGPDVS
ncbi:UDP-3-O-acyl-N-acetylglucosamine deacetylase [Tardiphaga sp.]|uniref:UDP-3-O-acyl-N-acetylglucosamine deacetylase n=1 Tax=Tardiphaga sp. TaxID=1926292 RepID=UPI00352A8C25